MSTAPLDLRDLSKKSAPDDATETTLVSRDHTFEITYQSPDGKTHTSSVVSRIMDGDERIDVARIAARRADVEWSKLPSAQAARIWAQATVAVQLRDFPDWLAKWVMEDDSLLFACFDMCTIHEQEFFRNGVGEGAQGPETARIRVSSTLATSTN